MGKADPGIAIHMPGRLVEERPVGGWPDLVEVADLAIGHFSGSRSRPKTRGAAALHR